MQVFYFNITYRCNSNCIFCAANHPLWKDEREMSAEKFESILNECRVSSEDRVIVNGGEPTVHKDFWRILDAIKKCGAVIDLFTNGIKLKDEEFIKKLISYDKLHIRVPLFGSTADFHDELTGVTGNFLSVTSGLDLLCKHIKNDATLEIKLLMSKATIEENEKIYKLIKERWNYPAVRVSLNPLLISECVVNHKDIFIDTYENMMKKSEPLIRRAIADETDFSTALIPYCSYPNQDLLDMCCGRKCGGKIFYASPGQKKNIDNLDWRKPCLECYYVDECNGFTKNYVEYFGEDVMKPFNEQVPLC